MATKTETARKQLLGKLEKLREQLEEIQPKIDLLMSLMREKEKLETKIIKMDTGFIILLLGYVLYALLFLLFRSFESLFTCDFWTLLLVAGLVILVCWYFSWQDAKKQLEELEKVKLPQAGVVLVLLQDLAHKNKNWFPADDVNLPAVESIIELIEGFKADTLKEALQLYDQQKQSDAGTAVLEALLNEQQTANQRERVMDTLSYLQQRRTNRLLREANQLTKKQQEQEAMNKRLYGEKHYWEKRHDHGF